MCCHKTSIIWYRLKTKTKVYEFSVISSFILIKFRTIIWGLFANTPVHNSVPIKNINVCVWKYTRVKLKHGPDYVWFMIVHSL